MAQVGLTKAAELTGRAASTITRRSNHKDPRKRLGYTRSNDGEKLYDVAELERVFGSLRTPDQEQGRNVHASARTGANANEGNNLHPEVQAALEAKIGLLQDQIGLLQTQLDLTREDMAEWREQAKSSTRLLEHRRHKSDEENDNGDESATTITSESRPGQNPPQKTAEGAKWFRRWLGNRSGQTSL